MKNKLAVLFGLISFVLSAQETIRYTAHIENDSIIGFKKVVLTPKLRAIANADFSDLRIFDAKKQQVPYFIQERSYTFIDPEFISINHKITYDNQQTIVRIVNPEKKIFNSFSFKIANASVQKNCKVEGSDTDKKWFVIAEKINLKLSQNTSKGYHFYNIHFPAIDYKFIRLVINDSLSAPIHIKDVGYFKHTKVVDSIKYKALDYSYEIEQKDNSTFIHVIADRKHEINKIVFHIDKPDLYSRKASIYYEESDEKRLLKSIELNSNTPTIFKNLNLNQKDFSIEIENKDNQPLAISKLAFFQKEKYLVADLQPIQNYTITAGDKNLEKPSYDLVRFKDKIKHNLSRLKITNEVVKIETKPKMHKETPFYEKTWFMWGSIGFVGLIILLFTLSLLRKTNAS